MPLLCLLASSLLALAAAAQDVARVPGFGRVVDATGAPWQGVEVHLEHRAHPSITDPAYVDRLTATTDAQGQFRVELLPGSHYVVWALDDVEASQRYRRTNVVTGAVAHTPILLEEQEPGYVRRLRFETEAGDTSWEGKQRRFDLHETFGGYAWHRELPEENGVVTLPPTPEPTAWVRVWHEGFAVAHYPVSTSLEAERTELARRGHDWTESRIENHLQRIAPRRLRPLHERVLPLRTEAGEPVVDGRIVTAGWPDWLPPTRQPRSDGEGHVTLRFAGRADQPVGTGVLWSDGHAEVGLNALQQLVLGKRPLTWAVPAGLDVPGRLLLTQGWPLPGAPLVLESNVKFGPDPGGRVLRTEGDGSFTVPGRTKDLPYRLTAALTPLVRSALATEEFPAAPIALVHAGRCRFEEELGDLRLDRLQRVDIEVRNADGTPPGAVQVVVTEFGEARSIARPVEIGTDHRGRIRMALTGAEGLVAFVALSSGLAYRALDADTSTITLQPDADAVVSLRAERPDGTPVAGTQLTVGIAHPRRRAAMERSELALSSVLFRLGPHLRVQTDDVGRARVMLPSRDLRRFQVSWYDTATGKGGAVPLSDDGDEQTIVLPERDGSRGARGPSARPFRAAGAGR